MLCVIKFAIYFCLQGSSAKPGRAAKNKIYIERDLRMYGDMVHLKKVWRKKILEDLWRASQGLNLSFKGSCVQKNDPQPLNFKG